MYTADNLTAIRPLGKFSHKFRISWSFQTWQKVSTSIQSLLAASIEQHRQFRWRRVINLSESLLCELSCNNQKCFLISLYLSPIQSANEFQFFLKELEIINDNVCIPCNSNFCIIVNDFNAKLSNWKPDHPDTIEGIEILTMTSSYGLTQIIFDSTHILPISSPFIDLLFTNQPNLKTSIGVFHSS